MILIVKVLSSSYAIGVRASPTKSTPFLKDQHNIENLYKYKTKRFSG